MFFFSFVSFLNSVRSFFIIRSVCVFNLFFRCKRNVAALANWLQIII